MLYSGRSERPGEVRAALRDLGPMMLGLAPFGMVVGVASVRTGVGAEFGLLTGPLWFGGSGQLAAITLIAAGSAPAAVVAAVALVHARFLLYGAALQPRFSHQPGWFRWIGPHFLTDPTYAMAVRRPEFSGGPAFRRYWLTACGGVMAGWAVATALGVALAAVLPAGAALDVAAPAMFLAMLVPLLSTSTAVVTAVVAAVVAAAASPLPNGLGLLCGMTAGLVAGTFTARGRR